MSGSAESRIRRAAALAICWRVRAIARLRNMIHVSLLRT